MHKSSRQEFYHNNISYNNVTVTISQHIENPGIGRAVHSGIFRHWGTLRHTEAYLGIIVAYGDIIGNILRNPCSYNHA